MDGDGRGDVDIFLGYLVKYIESLAKLVVIEPNSKWAQEGLLMTVEHYERAAATAVTVTAIETKGAYSAHVAGIKRAVLHNLLICDSNHSQRFTQLLHQA